MDCYYYIETTDTHYCILARKFDCQHYILARTAAQVPNSQWNQLKTGLHLFFSEGLHKAISG